MLPKIMNVKLLTVNLSFINEDNVFSFFSFMVVQTVLHFS